MENVSMPKREVQEPTGVAPTRGGRMMSRRAKAVFRAFVRMHAFVYRLTGGRLMNRVPAGPVLLLTTVGRKSGKHITMPLGYFRDGDRLIVIGSAGSATSDPAWVLNLRANPHVLVQRGSRKQEMHATISEREERERLWSLVVQQSPYFGEMQRRTPRQFPVVVLAPRERLSV